MRKQLSSLMQKEMTRKEFLATIGFGVATLFGATTLVKLLSGKPAAQQQQAATTYGASTYGGKKQA